MQPQINAHGGMVTIIHFVSEVMVPPTSEEGPPVPQWRIACMPNMTEFGETMYHKSYHRTDDVRGVTCPTCKKSDAYKQAAERLANAKKK